MDMNKVKGRVFSQETLGEKGEDGFWKVTVDIKEKVTLDGVEWFEDKISAMSIDRNFDLAHRVAMQSALSELNRLVYSRGVDSIFEGRELDRLEAENAGSLNNKNTTS